MRSTSSKRSHQSIMSGEYLPSREKYRVCRLAPVAQRAITFTLVISKRLIDFSSRENKLKKPVRQIGIVAK